MIVVTGAYGFIGSNLVKELNRRGYTDLVLVDDLTNGVKYRNLLTAKFSHYYDVDNFFRDFAEWNSVSAIYHQGAISDTQETNGKLLLDRNYEFTIKLFNCAIRYNIPISYASSASVYGNKQNKEYDPLNLYAYSKMLVDQFVTKNIQKFKFINGWRYFNVYGLGENHKGNMQSPVSKFKTQLEEQGYCEIYQGSDKCIRDFISVDDVVNIVINSLEQNLPAGIRDLGTGNPISFHEVAEILCEKYRGMIKIIPFPETLKSQYQFHTKARPLVGYDFISLKDWVTYNLKEKDN